MREGIQLIGKHQSYPKRLCNLINYPLGCLNPVLERALMIT